MHGYIIVCDVMNLQSMRDVPKQLKMIYDRSHIKEQVVAVFANKIELLDDENSSLSNTGDPIRCDSLRSIQEVALHNL